MKKRTNKGRKHHKLAHHDKYLPGYNPPTTPKSTAGSVTPSHQTFRKPRG